LVLRERQCDLDDACRAASEPFGQAEKEPSQPLGAIGHRADAQPRLFQPYARTTGQTSHIATIGSFVAWF